MGVENIPVHGESRWQQALATATVIVSGAVGVVAGSTVGTQLGRAAAAADEIIFARPAANCERSDELRDHRLCMILGKGTVAIVRFGPTQQTSEATQETANAAEVALPAIMAGHVRAKFTPMAATPEAVKLHDSTASNPNCADGNEAANAAMKTMELSGYDIVVALNTEHACNEKSGGGVGDMPGRRSEIYDVDSLEKRTLVTAIVHEIGHNLGLDHVGDIAFKGGTSAPFYDYAFAPQDARKQPFDLGAYIANCKGDEYGAGHGPPIESSPATRYYVPQIYAENIMSAASERRHTINPVQADLLGVPGARSHEVPVVQEQGVTFRNEESDGGYYATIALEESMQVTFKGLDGKDTTRRYDALAFVAEPTTIDGKPNEYVYRQRMYLLQTNSTTGKITRMDHIGGLPVPQLGDKPLNERWTYDIGGKRIDITMDGYSVNIRAKSTR